MRHPFLYRAAVAGLLILALAFVAGRAAFAQDTTDNSVATDRVVTILVTDASGMFERHRPSQLFIASNTNGWDPDQTPSKKVIFNDEGCTVGWRFEVPQRDAANLRFKFTRGSWDTVEVGPDGSDLPNRRLHDAAVERGTARLVVRGFADQRGDRWPDLRPPHQPAAPSVTGLLEIFEHASEILGNTRTVRVWLPPGYRDAANSERLYPVLYMHDGQNCFDAATAAFGVEWGFDETAAALIEAGEIPPLVIVGIDNAGPARSREYNAPSADLGRLGVGGSSVEAIGDRYLDMLTRELMPRIEEAYRVMTGPRHTSLGGSSFGGNITLYAAMHHPGVFGRILVESPAVPAVGERFFEQIRTHGGAWPQRVFLAMGTEETANAVYNRELVDFMGDLAPVFRRAGLTETNHRLRVVIEDGAEHSEADWARRLPGALRFLYGENPRVAP